LSVIQPGPGDGGNSPGDIIGQVSRSAINENVDAPTPVNYVIDIIGAISTGAMRTASAESRNVPGRAVRAAPPQQRTPATTPQD
ncbi:hypothetical protein ACIA5D_51625, partial [Actinoplanes sp. NPDC051513]|uniref:hypothetical protein n=1 Tax=Actinoplanes sp. NPDC051513 TaxID=3363908 RepID=UPI00379061C4